MNAFIRILQRVVETNEKINLRDDVDNQYNYNNNSIANCPNVWTSYYANEVSRDKDQSIRWVYHYINSLFYNIDEYEVLTSMIKNTSPYISSVRNKYQKMINIMENIFIDPTTKRTFINNICKTQSAYRGFSKLAHIYKCKKSDLQITTNMMFDTIDQEHRDTIEIYQGGSRYLFTKFDLSRIINNSLINSPYHFAEPLIIRNPYNNVPFSKSVLYTIYFRMIDNPLKFPVLFHNFVWLDFDLELFRAENECLIRETYFREYIYNTPPETLNKEMRSMLKCYYPSKFNISKEIPHKDLVRVLRPYYYLYLVIRYHISGLEKKNMARCYLSEKINNLFTYNPRFGRKTYTTNKNSPFKGRKKEFNMDAPKFTMNQAYAYHLYTKNMSDDSETEDEYDDNSVS